jgi:uncharacterized phage protein (TIGR01671 family)
MNNRIIKFRAIAPANSDGPKTMHYFDLSFQDDINRLTYTDFDIKDLQQFTGRQDKNGVDIYGSDIINVGQDENFIIEYFEDGACFIGTGVDTGKIRWIECRENFRSDHQINLTTSEVIGSIHSTPELLNL